ncbi:MAG: hypothetical protein ACPG4Z_06440 [Chitinophagales bacterium]
MKKIDTGFIVFSFVSLFSILSIASVSFGTSGSSAANTTCAYSPNTMRYCAMEDKSKFPNSAKNDSMYSFTALAWKEGDKGRRDRRGIVEDIFTGSKDLLSLFTVEKTYDDRLMSAFYRYIDVEGETFHLLSLKFNGKEMLFAQQGDEIPIEIKLSKETKSLFMSPFAVFSAEDSEDAKSGIKIEYYVSLYRKERARHNEKWHQKHSMVISDIRPGKYRTITMGGQIHRFLYVTETAEDYIGNKIYEISRMVTFD